MDGLAPCPAEAVWLHHAVREAVEVVRVDEEPGGGWSLRGHTTGVEDEVAYTLAWEVLVGPDWVTRRAHVRSLLPVAGARSCWSARTPGSGRSTVRPARS